MVAILTHPDMLSCDFNTEAGEEENGYGGIHIMVVFHLNHMQKKQIPLVSTLLGGWRIVWEPSSFHLLCVLCHRNLLLHFNDKVLQPLTPYAAFLLVILWSPKGRNTASIPSPTQSAFLQLAI